MKPFSIAIHGGAGTILKTEMTADKEAAYKESLKEALRAGYEILKEGGTSLDAVEESVRSLEDSPLFNAGKGSVFNSDGQHEMEAAIMCGQSLEAGAVAGIRNIKNPVALSRKVIDNSDFVFISGEKAEEFARQNALPIEDETYFYDAFRYQQWQEVKGSDKAQLDHTVNKDRKFGTVGAVALDQFGNVAAATSTGGLTNKKFGRIGDTPIIGAGTYANNKTCAVSCTGYGEYFIRAVTAYDVSAQMEYSNKSLQESCDSVVLDKMVKLGGEGGLIAIDSKGNVVLSFNSEGMYRAWANSKEDTLNVAIYKD